MTSGATLVSVKNKGDYGLSEDEWDALTRIRSREAVLVLDPGILSSLEEKGFIKGEQTTELGREAARCWFPTGPWDYSEDGRVWMSCAVVASDGNYNDVLLHAFGPAIDWHIDQVGTDCEDLGLHADEAGVWVWEGSMGSRKVTCYESTFGYDYEYEVDGTWRQPTAEEWKAIKQEECPWDKDNLPKWPDAKTRSKS